MPDKNFIPQRSGYEESFYRFMNDGLNPLDKYVYRETTPVKTNLQVAPLNNILKSDSSFEEAMDRAYQNQKIKEATERAKERVDKEKTASIATSPYDVTKGWRESTEDAAKLDKYTLEELGYSPEEAQNAYNETWKNSRNALGTATGLTLGTIGTLGAASGALGVPVADATNTLFAIDGIRNILSNNGINKTYRLAKQGDVWGATKSGAMDLLDLSMAGHTAGLMGRVGKSVITGSKLGNAYRSDVAGRMLNSSIKNIVSPTIQIGNKTTSVPKSAPDYTQTRVVSEGTYPLYVGPKHSVTEVVNPDGTINPRAALKIEREVADNIPGAYRMEARLENPEWHLNDPNTWIHTKNVAKSAWSIPTPNGVTKQDQMIAALGHDFGKIVSGEGHADSSAALLEQIFDDITPKQLTAISEHMGEPKSILGKITKQADILNGEPAITRFVGNNGKIRLRLPLHTDAKPREIVLEPQGNNKFYVHTRTWDGDHVPANISQQDKQTLYNALYEELPEGGEILFPQSGPGNYATRGTVAGLQRLSRDIRFKPTSNGVLEYVDKDGTIKTFEGTGFKKPKSVISNSRPISFEEKLGLPKSKRNQPVKQGIKSDSRYFLNSEELFPRDLAEIIPDDALVPNLYKQYMLDYKNRKNRGFDIYGWLKEMPEDQETIINNINDFAKTLPDYNPRFAREDGNSSFYITQFRDYLSSLGYETDNISDESILKILTHQYKDLSNGATGKLKGRLVFHGTDQPFESFDYHLTGKNTGNMGYNGAGNYFTTHPSAYGSKRVSSFFGPKYQIGWQQPYMITGIKATPLNNGKLSSKLNIPSYISPHGGDYRSVIDNAIKTAELGATKDMAIIDGISVYPPQLFTKEVPVSEFSVARNTGIKSLFPHPSRFIRNEDGTVSLMPTDWSDVRVNFKQGGVLKNQNGSAIPSENNEVRTAILKSTNRKDISPLAKFVYSKIKKMDFKPRAKSIVRMTPFNPIQHVSFIENGGKTV